LRQRRETEEERLRLERRGGKGKMREEKREDLAAYGVLSRGRNNDPE